MRWFRGREGSRTQQQSSPAHGTNADKTNAPLAGSPAGGSPAGTPSTAGSQAAGSSSTGTSQAGVRRLHMVYRGEVQGVGFRWNALHVANNLDLTGWVRNEWDGSVTMELQGPDDRIARFFTEFHKQYQRFPISYVIDEKEDIPPVECEPDFRVRY